MVAQSSRPQGLGWRPEAGKCHQTLGPFFQSSALERHKLAIVWTSLCLSRHSAREPFLTSVKEWPWQFMERLRCGTHETPCSAFSSGSGSRPGFATCYLCDTPVQIPCHLDSSQVLCTHAAPTANVSFLF